MKVLKTPDFTRQNPSWPFVKKTLQEIYSQKTAYAIGEQNLKKLEIVNVTIPLPLRKTREPLPGDNGESSLHIVLEAPESPTGYVTIDEPPAPFTVPEDESTVLALRLPNP